MPRTEEPVPHVSALDRTVLAVGAVVFAAVLGLVAWVATDAGASSAPPQGTSSGDGSPTTTTTVRAPASHDATVGQTASLSAAGASGPSLTQTISVAIPPGPLTVTPASDAVTLTHDGSSDGGPYGGQLPAVRVVDARGSLVGWDATVSLQGITGLSESQLAGAQLCVNPDNPTTVAGRPSEVRNATSSCGGVGDGLSVFFAPAGGGGGTFTDTAGLTLVLLGSATSELTATFVISVH